MEVSRIARMLNRIQKRRGDGGGKEAFEKELKEERGSGEDSGEESRRPLLPMPEGGVEPGTSDDKELKVDLWA